MVWTALIWLRIGTSGGLLWTWQWTFWFHKMLRNCWVAKRLAASLEVLISRKLVTWSDLYTFIFLQTKFHTRMYNGSALSIIGSTAFLLDIGRSSVSWTFTQSVGLLGRGISPLQGRYLNTGQRKYMINEHRHHASSGTRTHYPSVWVGENSSCLRPRGHCDRQRYIIIELKISKVVSFAWRVWNVCWCKCPESIFGRVCECHVTVMVFSFRLRHEVHQRSNLYIFRVTVIAETLNFLFEILLLRCSARQSCWNRKEENKI
jgi:hypothetical protein